MLTMEQRITFSIQDFASAFEAVGIEVDSLTDDEWRKFEDAFLAGTHWDEVAEHAADVVALLRRSGG
jgi:hypothetical protein